MLVSEARILDSGTKTGVYTEDDLLVRRGDFIMYKSQDGKTGMAQIRSESIWHELPPAEPLLAVTGLVSDDDVHAAGWRLVLPVRVIYNAELGFVPVKDTTIEGNMKIVIRTEHGNEIARTLERPVAMRSSEQHAGELPLVRIATAEDLERATENEKQSEQAYTICREKIDKHRLPMNLVKAHTLLDGNKILFFFTSEGRVDFRNLVKDLASVFHTRIELRQIGVRDRSQIVGGCGVCGQTLCCHNCKGMIQSVSIKMAKEQNLALNSSKISGVCGKLLCCLAYEYDAYHDLNKLFPRIGAKIWVGEAKGIVKDVNIQTGNIRVMTEDHQYFDITNEMIQVNKLTGKKFVEPPGKKPGPDR